MRCKCGSSWECVCSICHQWAPTDKWISIHDKLPINGQLVIIYLRGGFSIREFVNNGFHDLVEDYYTPLLMADGVKYWMEIPEVPHD